MRVGRQTSAPGPTERSRNYKGAGDRLPSHLTGVERRVGTLVEGGRLTRSVWAMGKGVDVAPAPVPRVVGRITVTIIPHDLVVGHPALIGISFCQ